MNLLIVLSIFATLIIIALTVYVVFLVRKIKQQKNQIAEHKIQQELQSNQQKQLRNENICASIRLIARATSEKQCNISEAAIRLNVLLETLLIEPKIDIDSTYPALAQLFEKIKDFATHAGRQSIDKKQLKKEDQQRHLLETELESAILKETKVLSTFSI
ncbi:hypothetical protein PCNPT3_12455 [Psychromonas sp. CNPT3]|uniref:DUF2489 domain-containing protein n=1 Tax=Psychromonas sp. CNPT3 TaxID=314282 RepID=UPI00006E891C|nr:DUF2489 domain-containing protein [Psychromonas sp. CNPT3]AGH82427.1 hypothetical protein PCNPT3_12455 [Psychromonas sp. CNPT3]